MKAAIQSLMQSFERYSRKRQFARLRRDYDETEEELERCNCQITMIRKALAHKRAELNRLVDNQRILQLQYINLQNMLYRETLRVSMFPVAIKKP